MTTISRERVESLGPAVAHAVVGQGGGSGNKYQGKGADVSAARRAEVEALFAEAAAQV